MQGTTTAPKRTGYLRSSVKKLSKKYFQPQRIRIKPRYAKSTGRAKPGRDNSRNTICRNTIALYMRISNYLHNSLNATRVQSRASVLLYLVLSSGCYAGRHSRDAVLSVLAPATAARPGSHPDCPACYLLDREYKFVWACRPAPDSLSVLVPLDPLADLS